MPPEKPRTTDPGHVVELLWGHVPPPGRTGLSVARIVATATAIADREGLAALSMRRLAQDLGVGAMSLYTYVPGRSELVELMVDAANHELVGLPEVDGAADWETALRAVARSNWDLLHRHPWLLHVNTSRPVLGPGTARKYESELRPLDGIGLADLEMDAVLTLVLTHVAGAARADVDTDRARRDSGLTDLQWWEAVGPVLGRVMAGEAFPVSSRVGQAAGEAFDAASGPSHALEFGMDRIVAGVRELISG